MLLVVCGTFTEVIQVKTRSRGRTVQIENPMYVHEQLENRGSRVELSSKRSEFCTHEQEMSVSRRCCAVAPLLDGWRVLRRRRRRCSLL